MPKRTDIKSILLIGSGPIIIGQACEFDYSGTQALKALKEEGYRVILVNSNPATIMTDPELADATYIEPITPEFVEKIIAKERPDALLPTMGGQTALNTAMALAKSGALKRHGVELIGANETAIEKAEAATAKLAADRSTHEAAVATAKAELEARAAALHKRDTALRIAEHRLGEASRPSRTRCRPRPGAISDDQFRRLDPGEREKYTNIRGANGGASQARCEERAS